VCIGGLAHFRLDRSSGHWLLFPSSRSLFPPPLLPPQLMFILLDGGWIMPFEQKSSIFEVPKPRELTHDLRVAELRSVECPLLRGAARPAVASEQSSSCSLGSPMFCYFFPIKLIFNYWLETFCSSFFFHVIFNTKQPVCC